MKIKHRTLFITGDSNQSHFILKRANTLFYKNYEAETGKKVRTNEEYLGVGKLKNKKNPSNIDLYFF